MFDTRFVIRSLSLIKEAGAIQQNQFSFFQLVATVLQ